MLFSRLVTDRDEHFILPSFFTRAIFCAAIYAVAALNLGASAAKCLLVFFMVLSALYFPEARRGLIIGGVVLVYALIAVWSGLLPAPANWPRSFSCGN